MLILWWHALPGSLSLSLSHTLSLQPVLVISYDMLRRHCAALAKCLDLQLLVCDEAHKLKNINGNHTIDALISLPGATAVILRSLCRMLLYTDMQRLANIRIAHMRPVVA
jgi:hypothetical protein